MKGNRPQPLERPTCVVTNTDLVGAAEIAERLQWNRSTIGNWPVRHPSFPKPVAWLRAGRIWLWSEVFEWAKSHGRQPL